MKGSIMQSQSDTLKGAADELLADGRNAKQSAVDHLHSKVDALKDNAITHAGSISSAVENAANGLDDNAPGWLKSAFENSASQIQTFADSLEKKDSRELVRDVNEFARQSPGTFIALCTAAGFAAARIFKIGSNDNAESQASIGEGEDQMGGAYSTTPQPTAFPMNNLQGDLA